MPQSVTVPAPTRRHCRGQLTLALRGVPGCGATSDPETGPIPAQRPAPSAPGHPVGPRRGGRTSSRPGHPRPHDNRPPSKPGSRPTGRAGKPQPQRHPALTPKPRPKQRMQRGTIHYQFLDDGSVRLTATRGHAIVATDPWRLWHGLKECHTEAEIAAYARWRGETPELEGMTELDDPTELPALRPTVTAEELAAREEKRRAVSYSIHSISRPDTADPSAWTPLEPDDKGEPWQSPNGRVWYSKRVIDRIRRKRAALGLATSWAELHGHDVPEPTVDLDDRRLAVVR